MSERSDLLGGLPVVQLRGELFRGVYHVNTLNICR